MPEKLFYDGSVQDEEYKRVRDEPRGERIKNNIESMWVKFKPFADKGFRKNIREHFKSSLWEMYLAVSLLDMGFKLLPRPTASPDICIDLGNNKCWIECTVPGVGNSEDQLPQQKFLNKDELSYDNNEEYLEAHKPPKNQIILRFTSSTTNKASDFITYQENGIISENDYKIIALNGYILRGCQIFCV